MNVPFNGLITGTGRLRKELDEALARVLDSGWFIGGPEVAAFETDFAKTVGVARAVGVANGTDAIALALRAAGVKPGDGVLVPALSAYPTTVGIVQSGATPCYVDVDKHGLLDVDLLEDALTPEVRAILCVHLYGNTADLASLNRFSKKHDLLLIEDCAQAHGGHRGTLAAGTVGQIAAWSFYPTKNLGALGDAGAVTTNDIPTADLLGRLRNYGQRDRYEHVELGFNSRLDPLQAAVLRVKLQALPAENNRRRAIGEAYDVGLIKLKAVTPLPVPTDVLPNRHLYPVLLPSAALRAAFQKFLLGLGVETLIHYPIAMPDQQASKARWAAGRGFPVARDLCARVVSLPCYPDLTQEQIGFVVESIQEWESHL